MAAISISTASDGLDAVFIVTDGRGSKHIVCAAYHGNGEWQQWGASTDILGLNVPIVEAWAAAKHAQEQGEED